MSSSPSSGYVEVFEGDNPNPVEIIIGPDLSSPPSTESPTPAESVIIAPPPNPPGQPPPPPRPQSYFEEFVGVDVRVSYDGVPEPPPPAPRPPPEKVTTGPARYEIISADGFVARAVEEIEVGFGGGYYELFDGANPNPVEVIVEPHGGDHYFEIHEEGQAPVLRDPGDRPLAPGSDVPDVSSGGYWEVFEGDATAPVEVILDRNPRWTACHKLLPEAEIRVPVQPVRHEVYDPVTGEVARVIEHVEAGEQPGDYYELFEGTDTSNPIGTVPGVPRDPVYYEVFEGSSDRPVSFLDASLRPIGDKVPLAGPRRSPGYTEVFDVGDIPSSFIPDIGPGDVVPDFAAEMEEIPRKPLRYEVWDGQKVTHVVEETEVGRSNGYFEIFDENNETDPIEVVVPLHRDAYFEIFEEGIPGPISIVDASGRPIVGYRRPPPPPRDYFEVFEGDSLVPLHLEFPEADVDAEGAIGYYEEFQGSESTPVGFALDSDFGGRGIPRRPPKAQPPKDFGGSYYEVFVGDNPLPARIEPAPARRPAFYFETFESETGVVRSVDAAGAAITVPPSRGVPSASGAVYYEVFQGDDPIPKRIEGVPKSFYTEVFDGDPVWPAYFIDSNGARVHPPMDPRALASDFYFEGSGNPPAVFDSVGHRIDVLSLIRPDADVEGEVYFEIFGGDSVNPVSFLSSDGRGLRSAALASRGRRTRPPADDSFYFEVFGEDPVWPAHFLDSAGAPAHPPTVPGAANAGLRSEESGNRRVGPGPIALDAGPESYFEIFGDDPLNPVSIVSSDGRDLSSAHATAEPILSDSVHSSDQSESAHGHEGSFYFEVFDQDPFWPAYFLDSEGARVSPPLDDEAMPADFYFEESFEEGGPPPAVYDSVGRRVDVLSLVRPRAEGDAQSYFEVFGDDAHRPVSFEIPSDAGLPSDAPDRAPALPESPEEQEESPDPTPPSPSPDAPPPAPLPDSVEEEEESEPAPPPSDPNAPPPVSLPNNAEEEEEGEPAPPFPRADSIEEEEEGEPVPPGPPADNVEEEEGEPAPPADNVEEEEGEPGPPADNVEEEEEEGEPAPPLSAPDGPPPVPFTDGVAEEEQCDPAPALPGPPNPSFYFVISADGGPPSAFEDADGRPITLELFPPQPGAPFFFECLTSPPVYTDEFGHPFGASRDFYYEVAGDPPACLDSSLRPLPPPPRYATPDGEFYFEEAVDGSAVTADADGRRFHSENGEIAFLAPVSLSRVAHARLDPCAFDLRGNVFDYCPTRVTMRGVWPANELSPGRERQPVPLGRHSFEMQLRTLAKTRKWTHEAYDWDTGVWVLRIDHISSFPVHPP
jgi:hypothetical protein